MDCSEKRSTSRLKEKKQQLPPPSSTVSFRKPSSRKLGKFLKSNITTNKKEKRLILKWKTTTALMKRLNKRLMWRTLTQFLGKPIYPFSRPEYVPHLSFQVLEALQGIVFKTCAGIIPKRFLELATTMFRVLYEHKGTVMLETLKPGDVTKILKFLNECHVSLEPMGFSEEGTPLACNDEVQSFHIFIL